MRRTFAVVSSLALMFLAACSSTEPASHSRVTGNVRFYNGATPHALGSTANRSISAAAPVSGGWLLSPDKITLTLVHVTLFTAGNAKATDAVVSCPVTYDKSQPGLTQLAACPFTVDTGTYTSMQLTFNGSMQMLVNDATNGFFSTATGIQTTAPAGGAVALSFTFPNNVNGQFQNISTFQAPLVIGGNGVDSIATGPGLSLVINGLQFFNVTVTGSTVALGGLNPASEPQRPDIVAAVGTLASVEFYARQDVNTANSYCVVNCNGVAGGVFAQGIEHVSMYYSSASTPSMVGIGYNGTPGNCPSSGLGFINSPKSYIALDPGGNLGWAQASDAAFTSYVAEWRMARVTTTGSTTTLYCKPRSTDPAPPGGSYAAAAPAIAVAANSLGTYVLLGK